jgi:hypothetical protein
LGEPPLDRLGRINTQPGDRVTEGDKLRKLEADLWKAADQLRANSSRPTLRSRSWGVAAYLNHRRPISFSFSHADVIDLSPPPGVTILRPRNPMAPGIALCSTRSCAPDHRLITTRGAGQGAVPPSSEQLGTAGAWASLTKCPLSDRGREGAVGSGVGRYSV